MSLSVRFYSETLSNDMVTYVNDIQKTLADELDDDFMFIPLREPSHDQVAIVEELGMKPSSVFGVRLVNKSTEHSIEEMVQAIRTCLTGQELVALLEDEREIK